MRFSPRPGTGGSTGPAVIQQWAPATSYKQGQPVLYNGVTFIAKADFTSVATFVASNWTRVSSSKFEANNVFHVADFGAKGDGVVLANATMTAGSNVLTSADPTVNFTTADIGKTIIVSGVGTANDSLVTTISGVTSTTSVTLAANAAVSSPDIANGQIAVYGTDDTAAIQAAIDAAAALSVAVVEFGANVYLITSALTQGGARLSNSQLTLPYNRSQMTKLSFRGPYGASGGTPMMSFPTMGGTVLVSTLINRSYSATYGIPSVIGGPTQEQTSNFSFVTTDFTDITVLTPRNPSLSAFNLEQMGAMNRRRVNAGTLEWGYQGTSLEHGTYSEPTHPAAAGFIDPRDQNQQGASGLVQQCSTWGYFCGWAPSEHTIGLANRIFASKIPLGIRTGSGVRVSGQGHMADLGTLSVEGNPYGISGWNPSSATNAGGVVAAADQGFFKVMMDFEDYQDTSMGNAAWTQLVNHINDPSNVLRGDITYSRYRYVSGGFGGPQTLVISGAANISVRNLQKNVANSDPNFIDNILPWNVQLLPVSPGVIPATATHGVYPITGTWSIAALNAAAAIHGGEWFNSVPTLNDEIAFDIVLAAGVWDLSVTYAKAVNGGQFQLTWEGSNLGSVVDGYNASTLYNNVTMNTITVQNTARHRLTAKVTGKNASSTNFYCLLMAISATRRS